MTTHFNDVQPDALRELTNHGSGNASTALSSMLGRPVDLSVPVASALPPAEAVDSVGPAEKEVTGVMLGMVGELNGSVTLLVSPEDAGVLCGMLGVDVDSEWGLSALGDRQHRRRLLHQRPGGDDQLRDGAHAAGHHHRHARRHCRLGAGRARRQHRRGAGTRLRDAA